MTQNNKKYQKFLEILAMHGRVPASKITREMRIVEDLRINGDDACELCEDLLKEYQVYFEEFIFEDYFASEASADLYFSDLSLDEPRFFLFKIFHWPLYVFWKFFSSGKEYKTLTVGQLYDAIDSGKWSHSD